MNKITFDTLKFSQRREKAGATREYAIAEAEALSEVFETGTQDIATKADVRALEAKIDKTNAEMMGEMKLLRWMVGLSLALSTGTIALLAKLFISLPQ